MEGWYKYTPAKIEWMWQGNDCTLNVRFESNLSDWKALEALGHRIFYISTVSWERHRDETRVCSAWGVCSHYGNKGSSQADFQDQRQLLLDLSRFVSFTTFMREMWGFLWQAVGYRLHLPILYSQSCCSAGLQLHFFCGWPSFHHFGETGK